jgi:hypothetical protein
MEEVESYSRLPSITSYVFYFIEVEELGSQLSGCE